jgi:hypothetical protein
VKLPNTPMTSDEFEVLLLDALEGRIVSDSGADDALDRALNDIAMANSPSAAQIDAARAALASL